MNVFDRFTLAFAPRWTLERIRARAAAAHLARHYEAAQPGRRTSGWARSRADANAVNAVALSELRMHARDLVRNTGWAKKARRVIASHTVGWGIVPRPTGAAAKNAASVWKEWAESPQACDVAGRLTFYAMQRLAMRAITTDGEVLIRRYLGGPGRVPLQLQVLEADHLDTSKDSETSDAGGPIVQGVEFDAAGRRAAYWLFPRHPGNSRSTGVSARVAAADVIHVFDQERPGQARGISWFGAAIVPLKDFDAYEDAELMRQKIAACFAAFVTDPEGSMSAVGEEDEDDNQIEAFEPGGIFYLPPGKTVTTASPPMVTDSSFTNRTLRKVAAALGVTFEDLTGDYSQVNFSSARMARLVHWAHVRDWQWDMVIPQLCGGAWGWFVQAAYLAGLLPDSVSAEWTPPPMPMLEPDREGLAYQRLVRNGVMTPSDVVLEQGGDPDAHWERYQADLKVLDTRGIKLDCDVRAVSQAGLTQERVGLAGKAPAEDSSDP